MGATQVFNGQCLCGGVQVNATIHETVMGACHCSICRKWGGGPMMAVECKDNVSWQGEENITVYDSSAWAQRGFCKTCGTHLFYRLKEQAFYALPVGLLNNTDSFTFAHQVFIDEKPYNYSFAGETHNLTGAEVFAQFGAE